MAEDSALKISALLAGGAGLFGAGVALGRGKGSRPDVSVSLSVRDSAAVELLVKGGRFRRERPGVFVVDFDGAQYRVARAVNAAVVKLGGLHFERAHWLAVTGMLEAAWLVLDAVPASRSVDPILLAVTDLPPRNRWSIFVETPLRIYRESMEGGRYVVHVPDGAELVLPRHRSSPVSVGDVSLSPATWNVTIAVLEAMWSIGDVMSL